MKPSLLFIPAISTALCLSSPAGEKEKLSERVSEFCGKYHTPETIDARLQEWAKAEPQNPDPYILAANAYLRISTQVSISRGNGNETGKGGLAGVKDPNTDETAGTISEEKVAACVKKAGSILADASAKFPLRLDIFVGRLVVAENADDTAAVLAAGLDLIKAAQVHADKMRWIDDAPLPSPLPDKVANELQGRISRLYQKENDESDRAAYQLSIEALRLAPDNMRLLNDAAAYHCYKNEWQKAREFLLRAERADPTDLFVKHNLAKAEASLGQPEAARRKWEEIVKLAPDSDEADAAREEIAQLPEKAGRK